MTPRGARHTGPTERTATDRVVVRKTTEVIHARLAQLADMYLLKPEWARAVAVMVQDLSSSFPTALIESAEALSNKPAAEQLNMRDPLGTFIAALVTMHVKAEAAKASWQLSQADAINTDLRIQLTKVVKDAEWASNPGEWASCMDLAVWRQNALTRGAELAVCWRHGVVEIPENARICELCDCPLKVSARGRPPTFCRNSCRQQAYRDRRDGVDSADPVNIIRVRTPWITAVSRERIPNLMSDETLSEYIGGGPSNYVMPSAIHTGDPDAVDAFTKAAWFWPDPARRGTRSWLANAIRRAEVLEAVTPPFEGDTQRNVLS